MKNRCYNPNGKDYNHYGGRGITVCDEWRKDFQKFYDWAMANGYRDNLTIDRIDANGNYEPSNCRWTNMKTQARNKRNNIMVEYQGENVSLAKVSELLGVSIRTLHSRYYKGVRGEKLFQPAREHKPYKKRKNN